MQRKRRRRRSFWLILSFMIISRDDSKELGIKQQPSFKHQGVIISLSALNMNMRRDRLPQGCYQENFQVAKWRRHKHFLNSILNTIIYITYACGCANRCRRMPTLNMLCPWKDISPQLVQPLLQLIRALTVGVPKYGKLDATNKA